MSFLAEGTLLTNPSWGLEGSESRWLIREACGLVLAPSAAIALTVLGVKFLRDGLRQVLDLRQHNV